MVHYRVVFDPDGDILLYRLVTGEGTVPELVLTVPYISLPGTMLPEPGLGFMHNANLGGAKARVRVQSLRYSRNVTMLNTDGFQPSPPSGWFVEGGGTVVPGTDYATLQDDDETAAKNVGLYCPYATGLQPDNGYTLEFRTRVASYIADGVSSPIRSLTGLVVSVIDDTYEMRLCFAEAGSPYNKIVFLSTMSDDEENLRAIRAGDRRVAGTFFSLDWTTFHLYRVVKTVGGKFQVWVDDSLRPFIEFDTDRMSFISSPGGTPRLEFGHQGEGIQTVSNWQHAFLAVSRGFDLSLIPRLSEEELKARHDHSVNIVLELWDTA